MTDLEKKAREYADKACGLYDQDIPELSLNDLNCDVYGAFLKGADYALASQWRDAEKEKPEDGEYVLIHSRNGIEPAVWNERYQCWDDAEGDDCLYSNKDFVKAWMEIPDYQPKGE